MPAIVATQALLNEARKSYHALMTGTSPRVVVDQNGERVEFTAANGPKLYAYIQQLEMQLNIHSFLRPRNQKWLTRSKVYPLLLG
jgi:hypothetical protein